MILLNTTFLTSAGSLQAPLRPCPMRVGSSATDLDYPDNFYKPFTPHSMCIRPASDALAASF